jgi:sec-independent protein translocase protein TatA
MSMPGPLELGLIFLVILLLFGAKRLPDIGKSLGKGIREFKNSVKEMGSDDDNKNESSS